MIKTPMTAQGALRLREELHRRKTEDRPRITQAIAEARAHGDLKENAEYHAAKERQSFIEGRIEELEAVISRAEIIDVAALSGDVVKFGATVTVADDETTTSLVLVAQCRKPGLAPSTCSSKHPQGKLRTIHDPAR
mgnify:CR=1 FL=1